MHHFIGLLALAALSINLLAGNTSYRSASINALAFVFCAMVAIACAIWVAPPAAGIFIMAGILAGFVLMAVVFANTPFHPVKQTILGFSNVAMFAMLFTCAVAMDVRATDVFTYQAFTQTVVIIIGTVIGIFVKAQRPASS